MKVRILIILLLITNASQAVDFYWISNSGEWNDALHWSMESGGKSCHQIPSKNDKVIFDDNSFTDSRGEIRFDNVFISDFYYNSNSTIRFIGKNLEINNSLFVLKNIAIKSNLIFKSLNSS